MGLRAQLQPIALWLAPSGRPWAVVGASRCSQAWAQLLGLDMGGGYIHNTTVAAHFFLRRARTMPLAVLFQASSVLLPSFSQGGRVGRYFGA